MVVTAAAPSQGAEADQRGRAAALTDLPRELVQRLRAAAATSPGRLNVMLLGLVVLCLAVGILGLTMVSQKQSELSDLANHREPVNAASQQIYRSLTDTEASSAAAFLAGGAQGDALRKRYQRDIAEAGSALGIAAGESDQAGAPDDPARTLSTLLPAYSGILETAAANNRQGFPVGASYLLQASNLMRGSMLGPAQNMFGAEEFKLTDEQDDAAAFPWVSALLAVLLVVALWWVQRYLSRRTNRRYNVGLAVASAAVVLAVLWSAVALTLSAFQVANARDGGSDQVLNLSRARLLAVQARSSENLALVAPNSAKYEHDFNDLMGKLVTPDGKGGALPSALDSAVSTNTDPADVRAASNSLQRWLGAHRRLRENADGGQTKVAIQIAVGTGAADAAASFSGVDDGLGRAVDQARRQYVRDIGAAADTLFALNAGVIVLCVVAAGGATVGIWQRLREYR